MKRKFFVFASVLMVLILLITFTGCKKATPTPTATPVTTATPVATATATATATKTATAPPTATATTAPTATATAPMKAIVMRATHAYSTTHLRHVAFTKMAELVNQYTNGRVKIEIYPAAQLFKSTSEIDAVRDGLVELAMTPDGEFVRYDNACEDVVFELTSLQTKFTFEDNPKGGGILLNRMSNYGIKGLAWICQGTTCFGLRKQINKIGDFQGVKIRSVAGVVSDVIAAFGSMPINVSSAEVYTALQTKMVDGVVGTPTSIYADKWSEQTPYILALNYRIATGGLITNPKFWDSLPADIRSIMETKVIPETVSYARETLVGLEKQAYDGMAKQGVTIIVPNQELISDARSKCSALRDRVIKQLPPEVWGAMQEAGKK